MWNLSGGEWSMRRNLDVTLTRHTGWMTELVRQALSASFKASDLILLAWQLEGAIEFGDDTETIDDLASELEEAVTQLGTMASSISSSRERSEAPDTLDLR